MDGGTIHQHSIFFNHFPSSFFLSQQDTTWFYKTTRRYLEPIQKSDKKNCKLYKLAWFHDKPTANVRDMRGRRRIRLHHMRPMKHGYFKNEVVPVPDTFWVLVLLGYFCMCTPGIPKLFKKKKIIFFHFFLLDMSQKYIKVVKVVEIWTLIGTIWMYTSFIYSFRPWFVI